MLIHIDRKNMRGDPSHSYVFCWVCMRVTNATLWLVETRTRIMGVPYGQGEPQWNDVECETCRTLYKTDAFAPLPQSERDFPQADAIIDQVQQGVLTQEIRVQMLVEIFTDFQYMVWTRANGGRVETTSTMLGFALVVLMITSAGFGYAYLDPCLRSVSLLAISNALSLATLVMLAVVARRALRRDVLALNAGVLDRIAIAAAHLSPTQDEIEDALIRLARHAPKYAKNLRRAGIIERIMNPSDTLRP